MRIFISVLFLLCISTFIHGQTSSEIGVWLDHLPYGVVKDIAENDKTLYCAAEQGLFIYNHDEKTINRLSKVNGLSDVSPSCLTWSARYKTLLIGYENGNIDFYASDNIVNFQDIKQSNNYPGLKRINQIVMNNEYAYICTDFGIVQYDMQRNIVEETFIIGNEGTTLAVHQLAFTDDSLFAATPSGLFAANRNAPLLTFESWNPINALGNDILYVCSIDDRVFAYKDGNDEIYYNDGNGWSPASSILPVFKGELLDMRTDKGYLLISNAFGSQAFSKDLNTTLQNYQTASETFDVSTITCSAISSNPGFYWVATQGTGLVAWIKYDGNLSYSEQIIPNSPARKSVIKMYHDDNRLFVAPGGITDVWGPSYVDFGYYELQDYDWTNHSSEEYNKYQDLVDFITDPEDEDHYYASSYGNGILEFKGGNFVRLINSENSNMEPMPATGGLEQRIGGFAEGEEGSIWFSNGYTEKPLGVLRQDGSVEMFSLGSLASSSDAVKNIIYTSENQAWLQLRNAGVVVAQINEDGVVSDRKKLSKIEGQGNLPSETVLSYAEDLDGEIWIGTNEGMAVLYSPQNIFEEERNYDFDIIVIDDDGDGNGERVLGSEVINDIEVDGSNKKWFGTANSGAFYTSENGKEQIYNFTVDNSPLPSNTILDIEIDDITGMVYFATDQGIVSFQGGATRGVEQHADVFAYPNPVEPGYEGPVLIRGLVTNAQVKITDIEGNIVFETVAEGGQALWSVKNHAGQRVKSGVYMAFITNDDGSATAITKIMVIN